MFPETMTWLWLLGGIILVASELFLPGLVVVFLGLGAMVVALLRWLGLIDSLAYSFTAWFVSSLALIVVLRSTLQRFVLSETSFTPLEEDADQFGAVAEVVETVSPSHTDGRISFQGTTWPATGELAVARLLTVMSTCQMQQLNVLAYLTAAIQCHRRRQAVPSLLPKRP